MATYTFGQLETLWINAGGSTALAPVMAAIALAESSGNPNATNPTDNNGTQTSWGLWQLSDGTHNQPVSNILDPNVNAQQAVKKYKSQGLQAWGTYTSGAYRKFLSSAAPSPVSGTTPVSPSGTQDASWWNPLTWGASAEQGIEQGLVSAFKAIIGPILQWVWWLAETGAGFAAVGAGVWMLYNQTDYKKEINRIGVSLVPGGNQAVAAADKKKAEKSTEEKPFDFNANQAKLEEQRRQRAAKKAASPSAQEKQRTDVERKDIERRMAAKRRESASKQRNR